MRWIITDILATALDRTEKTHTIFVSVMMNALPVCAMLCQPFKTLNSIQDGRHFKYIFWMKLSLSLFQFHWSFFLMVNWQQMICICSDDSLASNSQHAILWINGDLDYWCIFASLGLNESSLSETYQPLFIVLHDDIWDLFSHRDQVNQHRNFNICDRI